ncbi:MAG TPA: formate/nitrite transporter family protein [Motilibacteraceae bacterium]|nr:formate/nitrite transporter family protein [Motilibacteraceae bacterium]
MGAREELGRPLRNLAFSGAGAGLAMGISGLGVASMHAMVGNGPAATAVAFLLYPLGFVVVIIGRQQLFTENTLFPVAVVLAERRRLGATARLWAVVLVANVLGTLLFAWLAQLTPAVPADVGHELVRLGAEQASRGFSTVFWTGIVGGWLVALVAWLVTAADSTSGQFAVIVGLTYVIGAAHASHSIAGSAEVLNAVLGGDVGWGTYGSWLLAAVLGNAVGGVVMVALFNYGQVHRPGGTERARAQVPPEK